MYYIIGLLILVILYFTVGMIASIKLRIRKFYISDKNAKPLRGFCIVLISDLHGRTIGKNQRKLADAILKQKPDILLMAGDMIDAYDKDAQAAKELVSQLNGKVEMIAVRGNHFYKACKNAKSDMEDSFSSNGVTSLKNDRKCITYKDRKVCIDGVDDPIATAVHEHGDKKKTRLNRNRVVTKSNLAKMLNDNDHSDYKILLIHRPTDTDLFEHCDYDLALSGHTHGGQLALPFGIEPLGDEVSILPPKNMQSGLHYHNKMPLIITTGIGYSNIKIRTFMPPEIVVITFGDNGNANKI